MSISDNSANSAVKGLDSYFRNNLNEHFMSIAVMIYVLKRT